MNGRTLALGLVGLAVIFVVLAILYAVGAIEILTSSDHGPHYKHAVLLLALAVLSLIGANFARRRTA